MTSIPKFVVVDKKRVCGVIEENVESYVLSGEWCSFIAPKERCTLIDGEYALLRNVYGGRKSEEYLKEKGYLI